MSARGFRPRTHGHAANGGVFLDDAIALARARSADAFRRAAEEEGR